MNHRERLAMERKADAAEARALKEQKQANFDAALRRLHAGGGNDKELALELRVSADTVMRARKRLGLEVNRG
jgi:hypothetical protein